MTAGGPAEDFDVIDAWLKDGITCPVCALSPAWDDHGGACPRCDRPVVLHRGRILDFMPAESEGGSAVLEWSVEFITRIEPWLVALRAGAPVSPEEAAELEAVGLVDPERRPTSLGRTIAYHLAEYRCQAAGGEIEAFRSASGLDARSRVLDVGCGACQTMRLLDKSHPSERTGIDNNLAALALGCRMIGTGVSPIRLVHAAADALPFRDGWFTHVISRVALNYMHQDTILREVVRVLGAGGFLYCRVEGPGFDLWLLKNGRNGRQFLGRLRNLLWGMSLEFLGWQPALNRPLVGERAFGTARRLGRVLSPRCRLHEVRVTSRYLGLPRGIELVARKH
jgi:SAM-dependent methyltransferase